jgi:hypothetical protein
MDDSGSTIHEAGRDPGQAARALARLLRNVELTQEEEIDCTTCLDRVPAYVDRELAGADAAAEMPDLHLHLAQCGDCFEEYEALRDLVALDWSGGIPDRDGLLKQLAAG